MGAKACKGKVTPTTAEQEADRPEPTTPASNSDNCEAVDKVKAVTGELENHKDKTAESQQHVYGLEYHLQESQMKASEGTFCSESTESQSQVKQENSRPETLLQGNVPEDNEQLPIVQIPSENQIFHPRPESPDVVREGILSRKFSALSSSNERSLVENVGPVSLETDDDSRK